MKRIFLCVLTIISFLTIHTLTFALGDTAEEIRLYLGENKAITVNFPTRVVIGNPNVADIGEVTKNQITIVPKGAGKTTLVYWDSFGEQSYQIKVFAQDLDEVKRRVDNLLQKLSLAEIYTQSEEEEGKVFVLGRVRSPQDLERIDTLLTPIKSSIVNLVMFKEEESVVEIDVQVYEVDRDAAKELGMTWPGSMTLTEASGAIATAVGGAQLFHISDWTRSAFSPIKLDLLVQQGKARILSRPRLACQSGKEAEMLVGGEKPTFTTSVASAGGEGTAVEYKEYGIKLKIKPTVVNFNRIKLNVDVSVSDVQAADSIGPATAPTAKAYPTTNRSATTELFLKNGQTMAIGGLIRRKNEEDIRKVPWLGDIPILGLAFRRKTLKSGGGQGERGNNELFITLTPTIISEDIGQIKPKEAETDINLKAPDITEDISNPVKAYARDVQRRVLLDLAYPTEAREAGFQGTVKLGLHFSSAGELLGAEVKESSGYKILDDWAIATAKGIVSYPPFPPTIEQPELWVDIPITYTLD